MKKLYLALTAALLATPAARADSEFSVVLQGGAARYNQSLSSGVVNSLRSICFSP